MYEDYTRQALPTKEYRELLGSAICVINSNNSFIIENILRSDDNNEYDWYTLMDRESGKLSKPIENTITQKSNEHIASLFKNIIILRNRIIHSFQITNDTEQILATKNRSREGNRQSIITKEYLLDFIKMNEELCDKLHEFRGF